MSVTTYKQIKDLKWMDHISIKIIMAAADAPLPFMLVSE